MPRGNPKKPTIIRLDPALIAAFRELAGVDANFSAAVAEGLRLWLARERRRQRAADHPRIQGARMERRSGA
jgi:hypothetical protein